MAQRKHRDQKEREFHLAEVARLYLQGKYQSEIATARSVTQSSISKDLKVLQERWRRSADRDFNAAKQEQLAKIDLLEREAYAAWERSKLDKETTFSEQNNTQPAMSFLDDKEESSADDEAEGDGKAKSARSRKQAQVRTKTYLRREGQTGNPAYLDKLQWCIEQRCKILGLYAPDQVNIGGALQVNMEGALAEAITKLGAAIKASTPSEQANLLSDYERYMAAGAELRDRLLTVGKPKDRKDAT